MSRSGILCFLVGEVFEGQDRDYGFYQVDFFDLGGTFQNKVKMSFSKISAVFLRLRRYFLLIRALF